MPSPSNNPLMAALALHYEELVGYLRRRFNGRGFARDVVHDVCVQVLEKPSHEEVGLPLAFLKRALSNRALDRLRAEQIRLAHASAGAQPSENDDWDGQKALEFEEQLQALLCIIDRLPARQRQVFLLHRIHDMPQRDIASELEISANMVTQHFNRAMRTIAQQWEPANRVRTAS